MKTKNTLWHINWGDNDNAFIVAPDIETAEERMPDGKDMVNSITRLDLLYQMIFRAGQKEVVEWVEDNHGYCTKTLEYMAVNKLEWQAQLKKWGIE